MNPRPRPVRPVLLFIVYGVFLVVVSVTATAQSVLVAAHVSTSMTSSLVASDVAIVRTFIGEAVQADDLTGEASASRISTLSGDLRALAERAGILRVELRDPAGVVRVATDPGATGIAAPATAAFERALAGNVEATVLELGAEPETAGSATLGLEAGHPALREYLPLVDETGTTRAVVAIWRDAGPIVTPMAAAQRDMILVTLVAAVIAGFVLFFVFRSAQHRISEQTAQLLDSTRRDALTGMLNHGALVAHLDERLEAARTELHGVGVALVDLDGFKLLNETYGHDAGDEALRRLASALEAVLPADTIRGRYGPDEFLVVAGRDEIATLEPSLEALRAMLVDDSLQFAASERLPITISAGIASYPVDAESVTELLTSVATVLGEAKAGGGDAIRVANRSQAATSESTTFSVLQGLVFAIDTKDRYTKRHSEDVARYAVFLAHRLGLEPEFIEAVKTAGLLHDVGKIGIPESILRKPGRLTANEYAIVKQHVALGDAIVRGLVNLDVVRQGIRHHHERWDGQGYLHGLEGEGIPLVARILAVGDAFSAMTTSRTYRKAMPVREALVRLTDASGTQLDEQLVTAFVRGIETAPNAPLPGDDLRASLWVPERRVA